MDRALLNLDCALVVSDGAAGTRKLVEHLIAKAMVTSGMS